MELTIKQKELFDIGNQKGFLNLDDFALIYANPVSRKEAIKRFLLLGIMKESEIPGKFVFKAKKA